MKLDKASPMVNYGAGLFETMKVKNGRIEYLKAHMDRLHESIETLGMTFQLKRIVLEGMLKDYLLKEVVSNSALKVVISEPDQVFISHRQISYAREDYKNGYSLTISGVKRHSFNPLLAHKTTNYWLNILERKNLDRAEEAIFLNESHYVTEGTISNLFAIVEGLIVTPPVADGLLPGIMRQQVIKTCQALGLPVKEAHIFAETLVDAEGIFITNSLMGVMPVYKFSGLEIASHPWVDALMEVYNGS